jgi:CRP-like cAMP-binding protein
MKQDSFAADHELIQALQACSQPIPCVESGTLFSQGDVPKWLYILRSGEAALVMRSASDRVVMCVNVGAGSLLGLPGIIGNQPYTMTAMVKKGSEVEIVTRSDFEQLIQAKPSLYPKVLKVLAAEIRNARQALSEAQ